MKNTIRYAMSPRPKTLDADARGSGPDGDGERLCGILTDRDSVARALAQGLDPKRRSP